MTEYSVTLSSSTEDEAIESVPGGSSATKAAELTNKDVFEFYKKNRDILGIVDMFLIHFGVETTANAKTVRNKIKSVYDSCTYKLKSASKKAEFLSKRFDMPMSQIERKTMKDSPRKKGIKERKRKTNH